MSRDIVVDAMTRLRNGQTTFGHDTVTALLECLDATADHGAVAEARIAMLERALTELVNTVESWSALEPSTYVLVRASDRARSALAHPGTQEGKT